MLKIHKYGTRECLDLVLTVIGGWGDVLDKTGVKICQGRDRALLLYSMRAQILKPLHPPGKESTETEPTQTKDLHTLEH